MRQIPQVKWRCHRKRHRKHKESLGYKGIAEHSITVIGVLAVVIYGLVFRQRRGFKSP